MKVLHVTSRADQGGGPEHVYRLMSGSVKSDLECYVACPDDFPYFERFVDIVGPAGFLQIPHRKFSFLALFNLILFIKRNRIDIIHSHGKGAGIYSRVLKFFSNIKVVHTFHGFHIGEYGTLKLGIYKAYEKVSTLLSDALIFVSKGEFDAVNKAINVKPMSKCHVVYNGVCSSSNLHSYDFACRDSIVAVSRFDYQKNTIEFIEALKILSVGDSMPKVIILGDGEERSYLIDICLKENLTNVEFAGNVANPRDFYSRARLFVNTSRWEGLPFAPLEAMSEGVPCILSNVVGNQEVFCDGESGRFYSLGDTVQLANLIAEFTSNETIAKRFSDKSIVRAHEEFSLNQMVSKTIEIYMELR
jgi:glycosyltransferase involved in cell wall biosynthesis